MSLIKFAIDKAKAANKTYLVGGNRVRLADVDTDSVAEKLYNAKVPGVSLVPTVPQEPDASPVDETEVPALPAPEPTPVSKPATTKK